MIKLLNAHAGIHDQQTNLPPVINLRCIVFVLLYRPRIDFGMNRKRKFALRSCSVSPWWKMRKRDKAKLESGVSQK